MLVIVPQMRPKKQHRMSLGAGQGHFPRPSVNQTGTGPLVIDVLGRYAVGARNLFAALLDDRLRTRPAVPRLGRGASTGASRGPHADTARLIAQQHPDSSSSSLLVDWRYDRCPARLGRGVRRTAHFAAVHGGLVRLTHGMPPVEHGRGEAQEGFARKETLNTRSPPAGLTSR
jgi:hypothetical protein